MLIIVMIFGLIQMILDAFLWGIASYAVFMLLAKSDRRWQVGAWISAVIFFLWEEVVCSTIMNAVGLNMSDESIMDFVGPNMWDIDLFDVITSIGLAFGGFAIGRVILKRVAQVLQEKKTGQQSLSVEVLRAASEE